MLYDSDRNTLVGNNCSYSDYGGVGISLETSSGNIIASNQLYYNEGYGVEVRSSSYNMIWNNTFVGNNGATDTYNASHVQAYGGAGNSWNSTEGLGNWWSDWTGPDYDANGIVDLPYNISGGVGARDFYPRTATPTEPIPEFGVMPLVAVVLLVAIVAALRRMPGKPE
jgi:parallel beta-helix repeat protein